jgi:hypothetical protein
MLKNLLLFGLLVTTLSGWTCKPYFKLYREHSNKYFGIYYNYGFFVAQGATESKCRIKTLSQDGIGSEGIGQITYRIWKDKLKKAGVTDLKTADKQIKAQIHIMHLMYMNKFNMYCGYPLKGWVAFQRYNGGDLVLKEINRAKSCNWLNARLKCKRRDIHFKNGQIRNACDINYIYSKEIYKLTKRYYNVTDNNETIIPFW